MPQARDAYHHGDLRNALVASAVRLIEAGGPSTFSLRGAAREVGVSANAAYRHFDDKSALITAVAAGRGDEFVAIARFKAAGGAYVGFAADHPEIFRVMFGECGAECRNAGPGDQEVETPWTLLGRALDALVTDGFLRPDRRVGAELKVWTVVHGFASLSLDGLVAAPTQRERKAALEALLDFTVVGLCGELPTAR
jgi:AcrR family transcriptional regulator